MDSLIKIPTEERQISDSLAPNPRLNWRDDNQLIKSAVLKLRNYWKAGIGKLIKAPALTEKYAIITGSDAGESARCYSWGDEFQILFYGKSIAVRDTVDKTTTIVCDQTLTKEATDGQEYGDFFFTCNGFNGDHIGVIRAKILYDAETAPFTLGKIITGGTSGFTAEILEVVDDGTTGTLYLGNIEGRPVNDETITDSATGSATSNGTLTFEWAEQTNTTKCGVLGISEGNRLVAGDTEDGRSRAHYARTDQMTGIPFSTANDWNTTLNIPALVESSGTVSFRNGGIVKAIGSDASWIVALLDHGSLGFSLDQMNVETSGLIQSVKVQFQSVDWGSSRAVVNTPEGIIFANPYGVHIKRPSGRTDERHAMIDENISEPLGIDFFDKFDTSEADIVEDKRRGLIIITARDNSSTNNVQLVYHKKKGLEGWAVWDKLLKGLFEQNGKIYGSSTSETKIYEFNYTAGDDSGSAISTEIEIEPKLSGRLSEIMLEGELVKGEEITVEIDIKDKDGVWHENHKTYTLTAANSLVDTIAGSEGMGVGGIGEEGIGGGGVEYSANPNNFFRFPTPTADFLTCRVRVKISSINVHSITKLAFLAISRGVLGYSNLPS